MGGHIVGVGLGLPFRCPPMRLNRYPETDRPREGLEGQWNALGIKGFSWLLEFLPEG